MEGRDETALDICWELRLEPRVGIYRSALVSLLIANLLPSDRAKYAQESLALIEIIKEENGGHLDDDVKNIKEIAEDMLAETPEEQQSEDTPASSAVDQPLDTVLPPSEAVKALKEGKVVCVYRSKEKDEKTVAGEENEKTT